MPNPPQSGRSTPGRQARPDAGTSGLDAAARRIGDRWALLVVEALLDGPRRYSELADGLPGIAPNVLARRLRQLEADGVVSAAPYSQRPIRLAYELTSTGHELAGAVVLLRRWGAHFGGSADSTRHRACGTDLEVRLWCPTCERPIDDPAEDDLHHV